jgi:TolB-like protein/class 3 adenylate cyclase/Flp pilus assembly protein TadD
MASTRRLAAILAADVAGYSRLMGADEEGTHERLKAHLRELVEPKIGEHSGRVVKNTGDGLLAEFPSVVDAVRCAVEWQRAMVDREAGMPEDRRIRFRIGINLGDVIAEDNDIFGDGVNVTSRLEALAEPDRICISRTVRDQIRDKLPYSFEDLGEQSVKNIARPVRVYALRQEAHAAPRESSVPAIPPISRPAVAPRLSIVVLPFANLGNDPEQQYFADGITEDLTTDLSRIPNMLVISRNTAFAYQGKRVDTKQIGRELTVRFILEGSVRRAGSQVRVNAQLIDAETDVHLWAERFDGDTRDLFALQDEITARIGNTLNLELTAAEAARPSEHPDSLDYILRGRAAQRRVHTSEKYSESISWFERALALDPQSVAAQSCLAIELTSRVMDDLAESAAADLARAEEPARQALASSPRTGHPHFAKGQVLRAQRRFEEAILEYEAALAFNRNLVFAYIHIAMCKIFTGSIEQTIPLVEQAMRLTPRDPEIDLFYYRIGLVHLLQSRTDEAIVWLERARSINPALPRTHAHLASAYALKGETERAAAELAEARRLSNNDGFSSVARSKAVGYFGVPKIQALFEETYFAGLRKAGMPEE